MMRENLHIPPKLDLSGTQSIMDYTTVPVGLCIKGQMWTGQATTFTERCPKCGRIGVVSAAQDDKRITVHRGRVTGDMLEGIDYCEFVIPTPLPPRNDRHIENYGRLMEDASNREDKNFSNYRTSKVVAIIDGKAEVDTACAALTSAGFSDDMIEVFCGQEGAHDLDLEGEFHDYLQHVKRKLQHFMLMQGLAMDRYERALLRGQCVLQVRTDSNSRELAHEILKSSRGHFINFYGQLTKEVLEP